MTAFDNIQASVLLTTFTNKKKRYKVFFHQNVLIWDREKPPSAQTTVPVENIISVKYVYHRLQHPLDDPVVNVNSFIIHYVKRGPNCTLKYQNIVFSHSDPLQVSSWIKTLQNHLQGLTKRPKNLLLFINPYGGKQNGMKIYEKVAKPLFQLADVEVTVNISQHRDQIRDFVTYHCLDMYDAIACLGGDGTLSELFNGLIMRECRLQELNLDDMDLKLPKPAIPIGIIPGGSTDSLAYCIHGTTDVTTSVLQIIFGDKIGLDLVSVYDEQKLLRLYASVLSYGYLADLAHDSDKYRWLGPRRYEYSGFKKIIRNKGYEGEIAMLTDESSETVQMKCYEKCQKCQKSISQSDAAATTKASLPPLEWKTVQGKFFMVSGANVSCACTRSPNGMAPYSHLGDGNLHLVLVRHTSFINNIRLLLKLASKNKDILDLPFVEIHQAREFCFRPKGETSMWNCDGEVQHQTNIRAKVRCQLLTMFGRGQPLPEKEIKAGFFQRK